jgi:hypothetical protein
MPQLQNRAVSVTPVQGGAALLTFPNDTCDNSRLRRNRRSDHVSIGPGVDACAPQVRGEAERQKAKGLGPQPL